MNPEPSRTVHAQQAVEISELLTLKFADRTLGTSTPRRLLVTPPDGPSTDGGRKARQPILLQPLDGDQHKAVVCGWLDVAHRMAELKSFAALTQQYHQRFGVGVDIPEHIYDELMNEMSSFLARQSFAARTSEPPPPRLASSPPPPRAQSIAPPPSSASARSVDLRLPEPMTLLWLGVGFSAGFATCLIVVLMLGLVG